MDELQKLRSTLASLETKREEEIKKFEEKEESKSEIPETHDISQQRMDRKFLNDKKIVMENFRKLGKENEYVSDRQFTIDIQYSA